MHQVKILFFGSTTDSVIVLEKLVNLSRVNWLICCVVTQPPRPVGRNQILTPTPVEIWAKKHNITVLSFESNKDKPWLYANENQVIDALEPIQADLIISASYGQKIPPTTIGNARLGGINIHPSILPRWRGGDPVPWAIMTGDAQAGVTVVTLSETFDAGFILAQKKIPIKPHDTSGPLRTHLFTIGAELLSELLPDVIAGKIKGSPQKTSDEPRAKRLSRELGYEPWPFPQTDAARIERKYRALHPWPGIWTLVDGKRLKILALHLDHGALIIDQVQWEGKKPLTYTQAIV